MQLLKVMGFSKAFKNTGYTNTCYAVNKIKGETKVCVLYINTTINNLEKTKSVTKLGVLNIFPLTFF